MAKLEWLVLSDEMEANYTNFGDGRAGDASELVNRINSDQTLNQGHSDWRLPDIDELKSLIGTENDPKGGWFWSSSPYVGGSRSAWVVSFYYGYVGGNDRNGSFAVRLVRASQ